MLQLLDLMVRYLLGEMVVVVNWVLVTHMGKPVLYKSELAHGQLYQLGTHTPWLSDLVDHCLLGVETMKRN
jgi:hypothetical protein